RGAGGGCGGPALAAAGRLGQRAGLVAGVAPFYGGFGFPSEKPANLWLPGRYDAHRFLACELQPGALEGARGLVTATERKPPKPGLAKLVAALRSNEPLPRAASPPLQLTSHLRRQ